MTSRSRGLHAYNRILKKVPQIKFGNYNVIKPLHISPNMNLKMEIKNIMQHFQKAQKAS